MHYSAVYTALQKATLYLDPGSGSLLIQLTVAALLGVGLFIRSQWAKIKKLLVKSSPEVEEGDDLKDDFLDE